MTLTKITLITLLSLTVGAGSILAQCKAPSSDGGSGSYGEGSGSGAYGNGSGMDTSSDTSGMYKKDTTSGYGKQGGSDTTKSKRTFGEGSAMSGPMHYDPATVETIKGTILQNDTTKMMNDTMMNDTMNQTKFWVKPDTGDSVLVILGPSSYVKNAGFKFSPNDSVEVTGSRVENNGRSVIIASEVRQDQNILMLRDENGMPIWSNNRGQGGVR